jgi:LAO/AO transport system kinase
LLKPQTQKLIESMLAGDKNALARLISTFENNNKGQSEVLDVISQHPGKGLVIGVTGPPGAGKSTLTGKLAAFIRMNNYKVGIIAVDPSSPISGGAVLGDRVRMPQLDLDEDIFIRSMASRGSIDGLSSAVVPAIKLLNAFGKDFIIVETVGAGQTELGIRKIVDILVLVMTPGFGDAIQLMKAGSIEVANIIVVNKADQPGADELISELKMMVEHGSNLTKQTIIAAQATGDTGIESLYNEIIARKQNRII